MSDGLSVQQLSTILHQVNPGPQHSPTAYLRFARVFTTMRNRLHMQQARDMLAEIRKHEPMEPVCNQRSELRTAITELDYYISRLKE